ncbi:MAG: ABC transporter permease, partial [Calditrichaeota bacterium]
MFFELLQTAWDQIRAHRLRSTLTGLGIIIGIGTVILIVSVLEGYRSRIEAELNVLGANTFQVQRYPQGGVETGPNRRKPRKKLTPQLAEAIREHCPSVLQVGVEAWRFGQVVAYQGKKTNPNVNVAGGSATFADLNGYAVAEGRFLTPRDVRTHARVIILGTDVVDQLFDWESPLGKVVRLGGQKFRVIGVFEKQGSATFGRSRDNLVVIPFTTYQDIFEREPDIHILVQAASPELMERAQDEVIAVLRRLRKVPPGKENDFEIFSNQTLIESFNKVARIIQLGGVALG